MTEKEKMNCKLCKHYPVCLLRDNEAARELCKCFETETNGESIRKLTNGQLAKFIYQVQIGLRRGNSETDWEKWLDSFKED